MLPETRLAPLLVRQDGLVTLAQAVDAGVSARTVQRRVRSKEWERVLPRVFLVAGHPPTDAARVRAAGLWVGAPGAASGPAAAWWHGMCPAAPDVVELTVPREHCPRPQPGVRLRRRTLLRADLVKLRGLWVTDRPLTALETAAAVADGSVFLHPFGNYLIDIAFPGAKLAVEIDGWAWHMGVDLPQPPGAVTSRITCGPESGPRLTAAFRADRHKGNALVRARWDLLRFTWHDLTNRPDYFIAEIRAALAAAAAAG